MFALHTPTVNDWRLLCLREVIDQLNYSETHTVNPRHCDSIMKGYRRDSMSKDRAFLALSVSENYFSFIQKISL